MNYNDYPRRNPPPQRNQMPAYQQNNRRQPPRRKVTGRFYAFSCFALVMVVMLGVFVNQKIQANRPIESYAPVLAGTQTVQDAPTQAPVADPVQEQGQLPTGNGGAQAEAQPLVESEPEPTADPDGWLNVPEETIAEADTINVGNDLSARQGLPSEWHNILLLGSDTRNMKKSSRSDTIIIASVNTNTGQVKMTSIMRDTVINIPGKGDKKINDATLYGGPELMMKLINENLGMNITEYVLVNFAGMARVIDILDGIFLDITEPEKNEINKHMGEVAAYTMEKADYLAQREEMKLKSHGTSIRVNGIQAVTYARIRMIDTDYQRTDRQKNVLNGIFKRVKGASLPQLLQTATSMWGEFKTNINMMGAVGIAKAVMDAGLSEIAGDNKTSWRIPGTETSTTNSNGNLGYGFYDVDYPELTRRLYKFIYGTENP